MGREKKPVTFTCEFCGYEVTELSGPGQMPHYCQGCKVQAKAHMSKMRMRAMRERQKAAEASPVAPGATERRSPEEPDASLGAIEQHQWPGIE